MAFETTNTDRFRNQRKSIKYAQPTASALTQAFRPETQAEPLQAELPASRRRSAADRAFAFHHEAIP
jgi:hypothetical protein